MQNDNQAAIKEMLKSFAYLLDEALKKTTKTYDGIVLSSTSDSRKWNVKYNNEVHAIKIYGVGTPTANMMVKVIVPQGNQALAWFFVPTGGGGGTGDGATFYPSVSEEGIISWTNDKGLPNPAPVDIKGPQGIQGEQGRVGATGPQGIQGEAGPYFTPSVSTDGLLSWTNNGGLVNPSSVNIQGPKGDTGEQGETGPQGPQGEVGATGEKGETGPYFTPSVDSSGDLSWTNNGGLVNPETMNIKGPQGPIGPQGEKGDQGEQGVQGIPGEAATIQIGTVTSGDTPSVINSGTSQAAVFDFVLQQGPKGEQGVQGPEGPAGPQGTQGPEGPTGKDGLTISVNGVQQVNGNVTLALSDFGITASVDELNKLDGVVATTTEINYLDGVSSNIQSQLNSKISENIVPLTLLSGSNNWDASNGKYYQDLIVQGVTENIIPYVFPNISVTNNNYNLIMNSWDAVEQVESITGAIRFWASAPIYTNVPLILHYI